MVIRRLLLRRASNYIDSLRRMGLARRTPSGSSHSASDGFRKRSTHPTDLRQTRKAGQRRGAKRDYVAAGGLMSSQSAAHRSFGLNFNAGKLDHLVPLLDFFSDEPAEVARRAGKRGAPTSAIRAFVLGSTKAAWSSLLSFCTISAGVPLGAPNAVPIKGYEVGKGDYIELDPEELEAVAIESKRTIDIDEFVPKDEIDELYLSNPYYIAPDGEV